MVDSIETCRDYRTTIPLSTLKSSKLCDFPFRFYESLNGKNRMLNYAHFPKSGHIYLLIANRRIRYNILNTEYTEYTEYTALY